MCNDLRVRLLGFRIQAEKGQTQLVGASEGSVNVFIEMVGRRNAYPAEESSVRVMPPIHL